MTTAPDTEDATPQTPEQLLTELAQLHIRTTVPPSPKQPAAHGWQAIAGCQAAGFARALHALMEVAPDKAAEITDWYQGPFEEGPDPEEHTDWIERTVAKNVDVLDGWITEARELAVKSAKATEEREAEDLKPLTDLVKDLTDPDACHFDHHGYCQAHGWLETEPACPHGRAQKLFSETKAGGQ
jgi:hypothetical protein